MADRTKKIANILQTYFSDANLLWDKVLTSLIAKDNHGFVTFDALSKLAKFKQLKATPEEIKQAAETNALEKLKIEENRVARIKPYVPYGKEEEAEDRSIYVEGLSGKYKDETKIVDFFENRVGHVTFIRIPKNRYNKVIFCGYCFVEFESSELVQKAIEIFKNDDKLGLRVMSKLEWLKLKKEYLAFMSKKKEEFKALWSEYKAGQMDIDTDQADQDEKEANQHSTTTRKKNVRIASSDEPATKKQKTKDTQEELDYTPGIIIRANKLHVDAPKTAVISLLEKSGVKIAFMKPKRKGIDSAFIRLETPQDAIKLHNYFESHHVVQENGKDVTGKEVDNASHETISTKIIQGKEEEIYWKEDIMMKKNK